MVLVSIAISYPHPWHTRRSARRQSGQHGGVNPNLRAHSPQTSNPPDPVYAFAQVTGLRPQNLMTAKTGPFSIPPPGIWEGASDHVSAGQRPSHALGGRWRIRTFEAFAMDLQSQASKPVTSRNVWPTTTSVRIPHKRPTSARANRTLPGARPLPHWALEGGLPRRRQYWSCAPRSPRLLPPSWWPQHDHCSGPELPLPKQRADRPFCFMTSCLT